MNSTALTTATVTALQPATCFLVTRVPCVRSRSGYGNRCAVASWWASLDQQGLRISRCAIPQGECQQEIDRGGISTMGLSRGMSALPLPSGPASRIRFPPHPRGRRSLATLPPRCPGSPRLRRVVLDRVAFLSVADIPKRIRNQRFSPDIDCYGPKNNVELVPLITPPRRARRAGRDQGPPLV
ncbi:MAG: hypothetical protein QOF01_1914 [Thermomicrobiales bacterium]|nr:hypothetical protein [Thermomicrobiales bacterium]